MAKHIKRKTPKTLLINHRDHGEKKEHRGIMASVVNLNTTWSLWVFVLHCLACGFWCEANEPDAITKRVQAHITIGDISSAGDEAQNGLKQYPSSPSLHKAYIRALSQTGKDQAMVAAWKQYIRLFPKEKENRELLEQMAWSIIETGAKSSAPMLRAIALIEAGLAQDSRGIVLLDHSFSDHSSWVRWVAVQLAGELQDDKLGKGLLRLLQTERVPKVRLEAVRSLGKMEYQDAKPYLLSLLKNANISDEERAASIESLVALTETISQEELLALIRSDRASLRWLACELVASLGMHSHAKLLFPLLNDSHYAVRAASYHALGVLRVPLPTSQINDTSVLTSLTAAWALTLENPEKGQSLFRPWFSHSSPEVRLQAAAALAATGKYGFPLTQEIFSQTSDPYVRINLGLGLIGQRRDLQTVCNCFYKALNEQKERWIWQDIGSFKVLMPARLIANSDLSPNPNAVDQNARLEFLNILAVLQYPQAQQAIENFLKITQWDIFGLAATVLLTEGNQNAIELISNLLQSQKDKVRLQAALILALWGEETAIPILHLAYATTDRSNKAKILEAIGYVGNPQSISFLADRLGDPSPSLRLFAAGSLIQCLYH